MASFSGTWNFPRLAFAGRIPGHPEGEPFVSRNGFGGEPYFRLNGPRPAGTTVWSTHAVQPLEDARSETAAGTFASTRGGQTRQARRCDPQRANLEAALQLRQRHYWENHHPQRQSFHRRGHTAARFYV